MALSRHTFFIALRRSFLVFALSGVACINAIAADKTLSNLNDKQESVRIIEPKKDVPVAKAAAIDDERFELGVFTGFLSVEDFNTNPVFGVSFSYHLKPSVLLQLNYGQSAVDKATFEGNNNFLADNDRDFTYTDVLGGYRILRGRSFFGKNQKYNTDIYLMGGLAAIDFAGESNTGVVVGASYRVVLTDTLVATMDFRGYSVNRDFLDDNKRTLNAELSFGLNLLF